MYPFVRIFAAGIAATRAPRVPLDSVHVSTHRCWPWDIDPWGELNNGRALSLFDIGRIAFFVRSGFWAGINAKGWSVAVAGSSVRYRRRVLPFDRLLMRTGFSGRDARFLYMQHSFWRGDEAVVHALIRTAVVGNGRMIETDRLVEALGPSPAFDPLPDWIAAWAEADQKRPWPPGP